MTLEPKALYEIIACNYAHLQCSSLHEACYHFGPNEGQSKR